MPLTGIMTNLVVIAGVISTFITSVTGLIVALRTRKDIVYVKEKVVNGKNGGE